MSTFAIVILACIAAWLLFGIGWIIVSKTKETREKLQSATPEEKAEIKGRRFRIIFWIVFLACFTLFTTIHIVNAYLENDLRKNIQYLSRAGSSSTSSQSINVSAIDLGLSVLWSNCNLGASSPEESGCYFAWGEINDKLHYEWRTYKHCNRNREELTKYNYDPSLGRIDNLSILEGMDDAASVCLGKGWRIPTRKECQELIEQCNWTWILKNGVNGYQVKSKVNDNWIFLPAANYIDGDKNNQNLDLAYGIYWTSSVSEKEYDCAWYFDFNQNNVDMLYDYRYLGLSIRPVYDY